MNDTSATTDHLHNPRGSMAIVGFGFIGRRIAKRAQERGWQVRALNLEPVGDDAVELVVGSAQDPVLLTRFLTGASHIVYAAGTSKPADSNLDPVSDAVRNLEPLLAVLGAARAVPPRGLTFLSSGGSVYGPDSPVPTSEDAPLWPISSYGIMKVAAERYVSMYARQAKFAADILRCANVVGPGEPTVGSQGLIGIARARLLAGERITVFGDGSARRDYIHVDDLADAVVRLAEKPHGLRALNVGSGAAISIAEIIEALSEAHSVKPLIDHQPARASDAPITQLDISELNRLLDFSPRSIAAWLRQSGASG
ncbi:NAD-dependent epimerase/dehydratase family protein [Nocardioides piscis]|uniref:NAD-dependent epimerase/dehydratase family protein n=1 Tax=Nocardioides piscis TaxID=2714938 RepID=A0A6G7YEM3_9ACTN|nr:NAD-dependent epimerase/dehydratase family protein [Nocardioides piscis]QIK75243.1 NAD-dependent epimerase/dehydratase family protein [Nocardioides piscis]